MKVLKQEEIDEFQNSVYKSGFKGALQGAALALPGAWLLNRNSQYYRKLPLQIKGLSIMMVIIPVAVTQAERQTFVYMEEQWKKRPGYIDPHANDADAKPVSTLDWIEGHKWSIVGAGWVGSMTAAFGIIARNPYQTGAQKIVQARIWAQGLTIGIIMAAAGLTAFRGKDSVEVHTHEKFGQGDHSWRQQIPELAREDARKRIPVQPVTTSD
ncbi:hypothetical protein FRB96_005759 [Tulasnella sp. 330]|nr:hypothetical protein FRB96_005759 [Tulasnella sp. 330]KAG8869581.1 hypothetical protein FRB97_001024 [Tulasnella sp. 331]KAG8876533.1 hypothetical protein FRB98_007257 [Tulasnella sp. 332]